MGKLIDLTGQPFGYWTVLNYTGDKKWNCRCICGVERPVRRNLLVRHHSESCGCKTRELYEKTQKSGSSRYSTMTPKQKEHQRKYHETWKKKQGETYLANKSCVYGHGHTLQQKRELLEKQGWKCANRACDFITPSPTLTLTEWCWDHDHSCCPKNTSCEKCRRGLLCQQCNKALGNVRDDPSKLEGLAEYLRFHSTRPRP